MIRLLRFVGVFNAAVWLGMALFFTAGVAPAFFSPPMLKLFSGAGVYDRAYAGAAAQVVLERYYLWHHVCGLIALAHLVGEWLYLGQAVPRMRFLLLVGICGLGLAGGLWWQPKMKQLQASRYHSRLTAPQQETAGRAFQLWHGVAQGANLLATAGLFFYFWGVVCTQTEARFIGSPKKRG